MKRILRLALAILGLLVGPIGCDDDDNPVVPSNRSPVVNSLLAFPLEIVTTDSAIVVCNATDPDGDTLVYDWITDGRLNLKGVTPGLHFKYNSPDNSQVFFPNAVTPPVDTAWVQCIARDRKGESAGATTNIIIRQ